jgi:hypothetical protein
MVSLLEQKHLGRQQGRSKELRGGVQSWKGWRETETLDSCPETSVDIQLATRLYISQDSMSNHDSAEVNIALVYVEIAFTCEGSSVFVLFELFAIFA